MTNLKISPPSLHCPALVALPEATPGACVGPDDERGREILVRVEWAQTGIGAAGTPQLHRLRDDIDRIDAGFDLFCDRHRLSRRVNTDVE